MTIGEASQNQTATSARPVNATAELGAQALQDAGIPVAGVRETTGTHKGYALTQLNANR